MTAENLAEARAERACGPLKSLDVVGAMSHSCVTCRTVLSEEALVKNSENS